MAPPALFIAAIAESGPPSFVAIMSVTEYDTSQNLALTRIW